MLRLRDYRTRAKGLPDLLPYAALVAPGVVLCKDGSLLAAWEFRGQDTASSTPDELAFVSAQVNAAVKILGTGWMLQMDALRTRERAYSRPDESHFPDPVTAMIDAERRAFFKGDVCHSTRTVFTVCWKPSLVEGKLARAATSGQAERNHAEAGIAPLVGTYGKKKAIISLKYAPRPALRIRVKSQTICRTFFPFFDAARSCSRIASSISERSA